QYVLGKHSGRHAFREKLKALNDNLTDETFEQAFKKMKELADKKKRVFDEDIEMILMDLSAHGPEKYLLEDVKVRSGTKVTPKAVVTLKIDGKKAKVQATGDGPVDAAFSAIKKLTKFKGTLQKFSINAITGGTDAQGEVTVVLEQDGRTLRGTGSHTDIVVASVKAFLSALNRADLATERVHPQKGV
ncbi:MAG: 2-isopropylmalate synthase, partial [Deltaproteobacteria bacterium]|nr:2-isopropylmalate synthase [Deltaproteobacteria bacterium]